MGFGDKVEGGTNIVMKIVTTGFWSLVAIGGFAGGAPLAGVIALVYLSYLWLLGGRFLII